MPTTAQLPPSQSSQEPTRSEDRQVSMSCSSAFAATVVDVDIDALGAGHCQGRQSLCHGREGEPAKLSICQTSASASSASSLFHCHHRSDATLSVVVECRSFVLTQLLRFFAFLLCWTTCPSAGGSWRNPFDGLKHIGRRAETTEEPCVSIQETLEKTSC